jgi:hypothetical protein
VCIAILRNRHLVCTPFLLCLLFTPLCGLPSNKAFLVSLSSQSLSSSVCSPVHLCDFFLTCCCLDFGLPYGHFHFSCDVRNMPYHLLVLPVYLYSSVRISKFSFNSFYYSAPLGFSFYTSKNLISAPAFVHAHHSDPYI